MIKKSIMIRHLSLSFALIGFVLMCGIVTETKAQTRDPFSKPGWAKPRTAGSGTPVVAGQPRAEKAKPAGPPPVVALLPPPIEQRINYYKRLREDAATNGQELPKVTSVLTLDEMSVIGIFRTPRGYAAMVEAKPIKLSYTIYPGEKFFDGQLVAIEENRLVFRKVNKMSNGKFVALVENKTLRQYSVQEEVQGTAPIQPSSGETQEARNTVIVPKEGTEQIITPALIISPLDEMNRQPVEQPKDAKEKSDKKDKKPVKVAKNKKQ